MIRILLAMLALVAAPAVAAPVQVSSPEGVLTVIPGKGSVVGTRFVTHPDVRKVCFTGSVAGGTSSGDGCSPAFNSQMEMMGTTFANRTYSSIMAPNVAAQAFEMKEGDVSDPLRTPQGFAFVTVTVVYPGADPGSMESKVADPLEDPVEGRLIDDRAADGGRSVGVPGDREAVHHQRSDQPCDRYQDAVLQYVIHWGDESVTTVNAAVQRVAPASAVRASSCGPSRAGRNTSRSTRTAIPGRRPLRPFLRIAEHLVGLGNLLEPGFGLGSGVPIRMILHGELAVRSLDLDFRRGPRYPEQGVEITHSSNPSTRRLVCSTSPMILS